MRAGFYERHNWALFLCLGAVAGFASAQLAFQPRAALVAGGSSVQPVFSPGADAVLVPAVAGASKSLHIELYQFSFPALREAVVAAHERGAEVRLILDPTVDSNLDTAEFLLSRGVPVRWSSGKYRLTHSKTVAIDGRRVIVGSINWSGSAMERNREAAVIIDDPAVAAEFERVFEQDWLDASQARVAS